MTAARKRNVQTTLTTEQLASACKVSTRAIREWVSNGCPVAHAGGAGRPNRFDLAAVQRWRRDRTASNKPGRPDEAGSGDDSDDPAAFSPERRAKLKLLLEKGRLIEIERRSREGMLMAKEEVQRRDIARIHAVKQMLLAMPRSMAVLLCGRDAAEIETMLTQKMHEMLEAFASGSGTQIETAIQNKPQTTQA